MYTRLYVYMFICVHVYMYICVYVYMCICIYVFMYILSVDIRQHFLKITFLISNKNYMFRTLNNHMRIKD